jgi:multicomponent Na+:H+ antiporter subunit C
MSFVLAICCGILAATGTYMLLRRSFVKLVIGLALLSHAANLLIYIVADPVLGRPPLVRRGETFPDAPFADPLPGALLLTAIVISFGVVAFTIVLIKRAFEEVGTDDLEAMTSTDRFPC